MIGFASCRRGWLVALTGCAAGLLVLGISCITPPQGPVKQGPVVVINSDPSVEKYLLARRGFSETFGGAFTSLDLGGGASEPALQQRLRRERPAAVYCIGTRAYLLANRVVDQESIILSSAINWQRLEPSRKSLVIASEFPAEAQVTLYRYFFPDLRRIGVLCSPAFNRQWARRAVSAGKDAGLEVVIDYVDRPDQVPAGLRKLLPKVDALWITADPVVFSGVEPTRDFFDRARAEKKPVFAYSSAYAGFGATLMISADDQTIGRQAAGLLAARQSGESPADPVTHPAGSEITLNLKVVKDYGLNFNEEALDSVNRIIRQ